MTSEWEPCSYDYLYKYIIIMLGTILEIAPWAKKATPLQHDIS